jgi:hypothetical protein
MPLRKKCRAAVEMLWRDADGIGPSINLSDIVLQRPAQRFIPLVCLSSRRLSRVLPADRLDNA